MRGSRLIIIALAAILGLVFSSGVLAAIEVRDFESVEEEMRFRELAEEIRCLVCQNQSLADSGAGLAEDLRDEILRLMREGKTDEEVKAFLTARYGDFVLYRPPVKPSTYALWYGPIGLVAIGAMIVVLTIRRRGDASDLVADPDQEELDRRLDEEERNA